MICIKAKYNGVCIETGKTIVKGEECLYNPQRGKVYHLTSKRFKNEPTIRERKKKGAIMPNQLILFISI